MPSQEALVLRLLLAAGLAGALGIERELSDQPAGFRTHLLVGLGAALFAEISAYGVLAVTGIEAARVQYDPTRVAAQIVVGIGFLGGGAILKYGASVRGLTTAANLWVTAAVGTAAGIGLPLLAAATASVALLALVLLRPLRALIRRAAVGQDEFLVEADAGLPLDALLHDLRDMGVRLRNLRVEQEGSQLSIAIVLGLPRGIDPPSVVGRLSENEHVHHVDWSR